VKVTGPVGRAGAGWVADGVAEADAGFWASGDEGCNGRPEEAGGGAGGADFD
jgi:hypothetical protein